MCIRDSQKALGDDFDLQWKGAVRADLDALIAELAGT